MVQIEQHLVRDSLAGVGRVRADTFEDFARRCRTPRQFKLLLTWLRTLIPYRSLVCGWGYPRAYRIVSVMSFGYPKQFLRWYFTTGMLRKDPVFAEWLRTMKPVIWCEVARDMPDRFDAEFVKRIQELHLQYSLCGGTIETMDHELGCYFVIEMASEAECRRHLKRFATLLPPLTHAFQRAYPRGTLTERERQILRWRAAGHPVKQIATEVGISQRTVKMHLEAVKKKLFTDDLVNAVVIAMKLGMIE